MDQQTFSNYLHRGGIFEDAVISHLNRLFASKDEYATVFPLAFSKTHDTATVKQGQRMRICSRDGDPRATYMMPDFIYCVSKQTFLVEAKVKKSFFYDHSGKAHGIIDLYKMDDYLAVKELMKCDRLLVVFGDESTGNIHLVNMNAMKQMKILAYAEYKNPQGVFAAWELTPQNYLGNMNG